MMDERPKITLAGLLGGGAEEMFQQKVQEALDNLDDPNTPEKGKRTVVLVVSVEREGDRSARCSVSCHTKLPQRRPAVTFLQLGMQGNKLAAREILEQTPLELPTTTTAPATVSLPGAGSAF